MRNHFLSEDLEELLLVGANATPRLDALSHLYHRDNAKLPETKKELRKVTGFVGRNCKPRTG